VTETYLPLVEARSRRRPAWLRGTGLVGFVFIAFWTVVAITVPLWSPHDPLATVDKRLLSPSAKHLFGTDTLGRDVFTRALWGSRMSMPVAVIVIVCAVVFGSIVGAAAGFLGGWVDTVLMRLTDTALAFPPILLAMAITASLGPGIRNALIAMVLVWWPIYARLLRGQVLAIREREHVESAVAIGASRWHVLRRYVLPLSFTPVLVNATMDFGQVVLLTATLSFIGLGARPPSPEWGAMITDGATSFYQWWVAAAPGVAILTTVLGFNFLGDAIRDALDVREART
jgi:peptide/nickel transport system permease protein